MALRIYYTPNGPIEMQPTPQELATEAATLIASPVFQMLIIALASITGKTAQQITSLLTVSYTG